jgi:hypothetical protein
MFYTYLYVDDFLQPVSIECFTQHKKRNVLDTTHSDFMGQGIVQNVV